MAVTETITNQRWRHGVHSDIVTYQRYSKVTITSNTAVAPSILTAKEFDGFELLYGRCWFDGAGTFDTGTLTSTFRYMHDLTGAGEQIIPLSVLTVTAAADGNVMIPANVQTQLNDNGINFSSTDWGEPAAGYVLTAGGQFAIVGNEEAGVNFKWQHSFASGGGSEDATVDLLLTLVLRDLGY